LPTVTWERSAPAQVSSLRPGDVHVWRVELDLLPDGVCGALSEDERARAAQILDAGRSGRWARARAALRLLLAEYLLADLDRRAPLRSSPPSIGVSPLGVGDARAIRLHTEPNGRPVLAEAAKVPHPLRFSLSHSGSLALYALAVAGSEEHGLGLGVDIEMARRRPLSASSEIRLAGALGEHDAARLARLEPLQRRNELLRMWTRREAELKWRNAGAPTTAKPWIVELDPGCAGAGAGAAALALDRPPRELSLLEYAPG
jgi:hypothetical protein